MNLYESLNIKKNEYDDIVKRLKRTPNTLELYLFSAMWSEHCGYKHSKKYINFYNKGAMYKNENAGGIKINNHIIFFKTESHNHPSAVVPYQGAATGIGGIIRDILALNARPIALMNSLKFGDLNKNKTKYFLNDITEGISDYGNSTGIPNIGGETEFFDCYDDNPIVNVFCLGAAKKDKVKLSKPKPDNLLLLVGSKTGKDGLFGASFASRNLCKEKKDDDRFSVQIANPFLKKVLIEASLEILSLKTTIASQDLGAAGLLSSTSETGYKGKSGIEIYIDKVHTKEKLFPNEIMLSETQERMLFAIDKKGLEDTIKILKKYNLDYSIIGKTTKDKNYKIIKNDKIIANIPLNILCEPYLYDLKTDYKKETDTDEFKTDKTFDETINLLVQNENFADKNYIYSKYDYTVQNRANLNPEISKGASCIWLKEEKCFIGLTMDSNPLLVNFDPYQGTINTIYESYRNLISGRFEPLGITDCLNFKDPEKNEGAFEFLESIKGINEALKYLKIPIVSGNVSFYNESDKTKIYPSPNFVMAGIQKNADKILKTVTMPDDTLILIGKQINETSKTSGSIYHIITENKTSGFVDTIDYELEQKLKKAIFSLNLTGAIDVQRGGLTGAVLTLLFNSGCGLNGNFEEYNVSDENIKLKLMFGEITGRYIISTKNETGAVKYLKKNKIPHKILGTVTKEPDLKIFNRSYNLIKLKEKYMNAVKNKMEN